MSTIVAVMRTSSECLSATLFGRTRAQLLAFLYGAADARFYTRQLARQIDGSAGTVQRELKTLTAAGLIRRSQSGNQVYFQANTSHPVFSELRSLLAKTAGVFKIVKDAMTPLESGIEFAFVYGSFARGEENADSDVDLMVAGEQTLEDLLEHLEAPEKALQRSINPTLYTRDELRQKLRAGNHFLNAIQKAPLIFLIGDEDEFRSLR